MNYEGRREWIDQQIEMLLADLKDLQDNAEYSDTGIYYDQQHEEQQIEWRIEELLHEIREMDEGV